MSCTSRFIALHEEAHVYLCAMGPEPCRSSLQHCIELLDPGEKQRLQRFVFAKDEHLYAVSHALVRTTLARYTDVPAQAFRFVANSYGRPEIAYPSGLPPLRFNLSHTDGLCACVVTLASSGGIDVERMRPLDDLLQLAQSSFSPCEYLALRAAPPAEQAELFYFYWTLKEAYVKARGMGLSLPLSEFAIRRGVNGKIEFSSKDAQEPASGWQFFHRRVSLFHQLAVALPRGSRPIKRVTVRWTDTPGGDGGEDLDEHLSGF